MNEGIVALGDIGTRAAVRHESAIAKNAIKQLEIIMKHIEMNGMSHTDYDECGIQMNRILQALDEEFK